MVVVEGILRDRIIDKAVMVVVEGILRDRIIDKAVMVVVEGILRDRIIDKAVMVVVEGILKGATAVEADTPRGATEVEYPNETPTYKAHTVVAFAKLKMLSAPLLQQ
jgi:hypothetical protein